MFCCIAEIGMMIFGIVTLVRGKFSLSCNRVVCGAPAYVIGVILTATLPLIMFTGFVIGIFIGLNSRGRQINVQDLQGLAFLDVFFVAISFIIVLCIAVIYSENPRLKSSTESPQVQPPKTAFWPKPLDSEAFAAMRGRVENLLFQMESINSDDYKNIFQALDEMKKNLQNARHQISDADFKIANDYLEGLQQKLIDIRRQGLV